MIGNPIPDEYKVREQEPHNLTSFRDQYEQRLAALERQLDKVEKSIPYSFPVSNDKTEYGGFLVVRDLEYTTFKIYDLSGKEVPGLSEGSFKQYNRALAHIDRHNALRKVILSES